MPQKVNKWLTISTLPSVSAEQQLQPLLCYILPAAGESAWASRSAAEPPVWNMEPETQEHLGLHGSRGQCSSWVQPVQTSTDPISIRCLKSNVLCALCSLLGDHGVYWQFQNDSVFPSSQKHSSRVLRGGVWPSWIVSGKLLTNRPNANPATQLCCHSVANGRFPSVSACGVSGGGQPEQIALEPLHFT